MLPTLSDQLFIRMITFPEYPPNTWIASVPVKTEVEPNAPKARD